MLPVRITLKRLFILRPEHLGIDRGANRVVHFLRRRPDIFQINRLAIRAGAQRLRSHIDIHRARQRIRHHQRRRRQIVRLHLRIDAAFKIPVAAQHRRHHQISVFTAADTASGSGPLLPMQVVQP